MAHKNHPFALFFSFSACHSLPRSSRSQRIAPNPRAHRAEAPISNGVCSCDRRDNDLFLLVLIAHNIQNKNVEVWKSGERLKSNNSVTYAHLIKMPFAAKKLDGLADREKGWLALNHPLILFCCFSAFPLIFCCLKAHVHKEPHYILGRVGQKHRDPMELVHVVRRVDTVRRSK